MPVRVHSLLHVLTCVSCVSLFPIRYVISTTHPRYCELDRTGRRAARVGGFKSLGCSVCACVVCAKVFPKLELPERLAKFGWRSWRYSMPTALSLATTRTRCAEFRTKRTHELYNCVGFPLTVPNVLRNPMRQCDRANSSSAGHRQNVVRVPQISIEQHPGIGMIVGPARSTINVLMFFCCCGGALSGAGTRVSCVSLRRNVIDIHIVPRSNQRVSMNMTYAICYTQHASST